MCADARGPAGRARAGLPLLTLLLTPLLALTALLPGCQGPDAGPGGKDEPGSDAARGSAFERVDLQIALAEWTLGFEGSPFVEGLQRQPTIAVLRIANDTSEPIDDALETLLDTLEARLQQSGRFAVVTHQTIMADEILAERLEDLGDDLDDATLAGLVREFGLEYVLYGRVHDTVDPENEQAVRYDLFLRCTELSTRLIRYQAQTELVRQGGA